MEEVIVMLILDALKFFETKSTKCVGNPVVKPLTDLGWGGGEGTSVWNKNGQKLGVRGFIPESSRSGTDGNLFSFTTV